jgi:eukaryotic-like serine/threonine-protein kinase
MDTTLSRPVAIKILPDAFASDPERLSRFAREARTLASLNDPHIAAIYAVEKSGGSLALVMELVEGDDLSQRIAGGAIPLDEALPIAKQIAEALEAAHEQGIIHRDLKPANIKVRPDGTVKVLDFGLAKAMDSAAASSPGMSMSATITTPAMTQTGMILGTAAYMAPEQARGTSVDRRADIWAFGAVLFEMLAGRRPFEGEDTAELLGAVVHLDPRWDALPATVPPRITQVLRACLQKDPKRRLGDMQSVRLALDGAFETETSGPVEAGRLPWTRLLAAGAGAVMAGAFTAVVLAWRLWPTVAPAPEVRFEISTPESQFREFAVSPDGGSIVFEADDNGTPKLWLRQLNHTEAHPLKGTDNGRHPFWSPDGRSIGFIERGMRRLKRVDLDGGVTNLTNEAAAMLVRGTWNREGIILIPVPGGLAQVPAKGGPPEMVVKAPVVGNTSPVFLQDGQRFLCYLQGEKEGIYWGSLNGAPLKFLTAAESSGQVVQDRLFYINQGSLFARTLDLDRMELTGEPERIADEARAFSLSDSGFIAYRAATGQARSQLRWWDRHGKPGDVVGEPGNYSAVALSPDGRRVATDRGIQGNRDVWILDILRGAASRFTFDPSQDGYPVWSPDGTEIAFESDRKDPFDIYLKPSDSAAAEKPVLELPGVQWPLDWSRDGKYLLYLTASNIGAPTDLAALPMDAAEQKPIPITETPFWERNGAFSPDGQWVAYETNESGRYEIVVTSFPNASGKWQVSTSGGVQPRWRADGKEISFISPDQIMMAAGVRASGASLETDKPVALFETRRHRGIGGIGPLDDKHQYDVSRDGRFLINETVDEAGSTPPITIILNWRPKSK